MFRQTKPRSFTLRAPAVPEDGLKPPSPAARG
jgi:hypothetical protein